MHHENDNRRKGVSGNDGRNLSLSRRENDSIRVVKITRGGVVRQSGRCSCGGVLVRRGYCFVCTSCGGGSCD